MFQPFGAKHITEEMLEKLAKDMESLPPTPKHLLVNKTWLDEQIEKGEISTAKEEKKLFSLPSGIPVKIDNTIDTWKLEY